MKILDKFVVASLGGAAAGYFLSKGIDSIASYFSFSNPLFYFVAGIVILYLLRRFRVLR